MDYNMSTTTNSIDFQAAHGPIHERRRYIKSRIIDAERSSDHDAVDVWKNTLLELENASDYLQRSKR